MSTATPTVEIAWTGRQVGVFKIGSSTIGGTDTLGGFFGANAFDDITSVVKKVRIRRGRSNDLGPMQVGGCTLTLKDTDGTYNPLNSGSTLAGYLVPMRPVRVMQTFGGTDYVRFRGFIRSITPTADRSNPEVMIDCIDLFAWLSRVRPVIASTGATTTGAAIGKVLDAIGWTETSLRDLDTGDTIGDFSADGTKTGLQLIEDLLTTERGAFYVSRAGVATFEDRYAMYRSPRDSAQSSLADTMRLIMPAVDLDAVKNAASVTKTGNAAQTASDADSQYAYGYSDWGAIDSAYLASDAQALSLAHWLVAQGKDAVGRAWQMTFPPNRSDALMTAALSRDLLDRVSISDTIFGTSGQFHVQGIEETIRPGDIYECSWILSRRPTAEPFMIGSSTIGGTHVFVY